MHFRGSYQNVAAASVASLVIMVVHENERVLVITHAPALLKKGVNYEKGLLT